MKGLASTWELWHTRFELYIYNIVKLETGRSLEVYPNTTYGRYHVLCSVTWTIAIRPQLRDHAQGLVVSQKAPYRQDEFPHSRAVRLSSSHLLIKAGSIFVLCDSSSLVTVGPSSCSAKILKIPVLIPTEASADCRGCGFPY